MTHGTTYTGPVSRAFGFIVLAIISVLALYALRSFGTGCDIKGNIASSGERIYHVPGGEYYAPTRISWLKGERWFCSESEARAAGWRRSRR